MHIFKTKTEPSILERSQFGEEGTFHFCKVPKFWKVLQLRNIFQLFLNFQGQEDLPQISR
jgi:hypothetical protein